MKRLTVAGKTRLALEVLRAYVRVRVRFRDRDLRGTLRDLRSGASPPESASNFDVHLGMRLGRAVRRTLPLLPTDSRCLMQSLVLTSMLAQRGIGSDLVIGVKPGESFGAHAWVELRGVALLPADDDEFPRLAAL